MAPRPVAVKLRRNGVALGGHEWVLQPVSNRAQEEARLLRLIRASFTASHGVYGVPRVFLASESWRDLQ
jgi:putative transposase